MKICSEKENKIRENEKRGTYIYVDTYVSSTLTCGFRDCTSVCLSASVLICGYVLMSLWFCVERFMTLIMIYYILQRGV